MDERERKRRELIDRFGLMVQLVGEGDGFPPFAYSIGLWETYQHPEVLIIGFRWDLKSMHILINNMAETIKAGEHFRTGATYDDIVVGYNCQFVAVPNGGYHDWVGQAIDHYGGEWFPLLQCVWPDLNHRYPWDSDFNPDWRDRQPVLGQPPKIH